MLFRLTTRVKTGRYGGGGNVERVHAPAPRSPDGATKRSGMTSSSRHAAPLTFQRNTGNAATAHLVQSRGRSAGATYTPRPIPPMADANAVRSTIASVVDHWGRHGSGSVANVPQKAAPPTRPREQSGPGWERAAGHAPRFPGTLAVQAKLEVGPVDDAFEREADAVADQIMRIPAPGTADAPPHIQRPCAACAAGGTCSKIGAEEEQLQRQPTCSDSPAPVRSGSSASGFDLPPAFSTRIDAMRGTGTPLPRATREFFEPRFGHSFDEVRSMPDRPPPRPPVRSAPAPSPSAPTSSSEWAISRRIR